MTKKKRKLNKKGILKLLIIILIIVSFIVFINNLKVTQIEIIGTNYITDTEIIEKLNLTYYPKMVEIPTFKIKNKLKEIDMIDNVEVKRNIWGKLTLKISEAKPLLIKKSSAMIVLSNSKEIEKDIRFLGLPTLINYVPDEIYANLISGLSKVDTDVLSIISEIEYTPSKALDGTIIDSTRFLLRMNDTNTVYMNTINVTQLNKYIDICSAILATQGQKYGILYLDSSTEENFSFESYQSIEKEEEKNGEQN